MPPKTKDKYKPSKAQQQKSKEGVLNKKGSDPGGTIKKLSNYKSDLKETKSVDQATRRGKLRKKYGDKKVNESIGGKNAVADNIKNKKKKK
jgi:hypothetical protein